MIVIMTQNMFVCDICGNEMSSSHYHLPAEIKEANKIKFVHMECCSDEEIKKNLLSYAQDQIRFYHDIIDLVNDTNMKNIKDFEMKYGNYEEVSQGIRIDRDTYIASLISELKKR
jgi:transcription elongation factor Elf1